MDYARVLLSVLWQDFGFFVPRFLLFALLLTPTSLVMALVIRRVYEGAPLRTLAAGTLYGWCSGLVVFAVFFLVATLLNPSIHWTHEAMQASNGIAVIFYALVTVVAAAQSFHYVDYYYNRREESRPPWRFAFTLRTLVIGQVVLGLLIGWWATSRREAIASHYERMQLLRYEAEVAERFGRYGWATSVNLATNSGEAQTQLELYLYENEDLVSFSDDVLQEIKPSDHVRLLQVNSPNLTDEGLASIGKLHSLRRLSIRSNQITDSGLAQLTQLPHLYELYLDCSEITPRGLEDFSTMPALRRLTITSNMGAEQERDLRKQFSDTEVHFHRPYGR